MYVITEVSNEFAFKKIFISNENVQNLEKIIYFDSL